MDLRSILVRKVVLWEPVAAWVESVPPYLLGNVRRPTEHSRTQTKAIVVKAAQVNSSHAILAEAKLGVETLAEVKVTLVVKPLIPYPVA